MPRTAPPAKVACRLCHDRRVRCDRSQGVPCTNCRRAQHECEAIVSRRGRTRKLPLPPKGSESSRRISPAASQTVSQEGATNSAPCLATPHVQDTREQRSQPCFPALESSGKIPYVVDSSNLNYLIQQFGNPFGGTADARRIQDHLQGAMLARVGLATSQQIEELRISGIAHLKSKGAFDLPPQETSRALLDAYFHYSHASLPILDRSRFLADIEKGSFSHLLLNAVYLTATVYCSDSVIAIAGFASRYAASLTFYRRAKSLHDAGYEPDTISTIQATFLMCHWWSGILEPQDPWYWIGISTGTAHALGLHQAKSYGRLELQDQRLWRRLWWMLYAMDINLSMLLDRPPHVQGRLCNVPPLSAPDFEQEDGLNEQDAFPESPSEVHTFAINYVQLARIVDQFFTLKFNEDSGQSQDICLEQISSWWSSFPEEFHSLSTSSSAGAILTQIVYQTYRLILHRSNPRYSLSTGTSTPMFGICTEISHILEILLSKDLIYAAAASIIAPVLAVLSVHIINIYRGDTGVRMISEHRARLCMVILEKLQDRFPVVAAFLPIYESLLKRKDVTIQTKRKRKVQEAPATEPSPQTGTGQLENETAFDIVSNTGSLFDQVLQDTDMGTMFPFSFPFGNLFEDVFFGTSYQSTAYHENEVP
ncbi:transcriptional regulator family: Fungal Specific TF [Penicillium sp. DV-2018c]|nr:transcriptional regulator family: Fungal Specific TF [Penicillium sp. DV-2018c]KAJ5572030.1 transcriptional regulator family: Fungal Specific TF [Penicillium sp. DV-2018c]